jgi:hypothetical protein
MRARTLLDGALALVLSLPAGASAAVVLTSDPVAGWLPPAVVDAVRPVAAAVFGLTARLPPDSLPGRLFYGSFAPLPALVGSAALAVHAMLLGAPWAVLAALAARHALRATPGAAGGRWPRARPPPA